MGAVLRPRVDVRAIDAPHVRAKEDGMVEHEACPCLHTTPCHDRCTCRMPASSSGCRRCCSYGSKQQQCAKAEVLALIIDEIQLAHCASGGQLELDVDGEIHNASTTIDADQYDMGLARGRALALEVAAQECARVAQQARNRAAGGHEPKEYAGAEAAAADECERRIRALLSDAVVGRAAWGSRPDAEREPA